MKYVVALAAGMMLYVAAPAAVSAQGWNQKAYNNSQAAQTSQQQYNRQTGGR